MWRLPAAHRGFQETAKVCSDNRDRRGNALALRAQVEVILHAECRDQKNGQDQEQPSAKCIEKFHPYKGLKLLLWFPLKKLARLST